MTTPATPSNSKPAGDDRDPAPVAVGTFEDGVNTFWKKNRTIVFAVCAVVLIAIIGKGVMEYTEKSKELDVEKAYAAATTTEQLKSFIAAHPDHSLSGVASVRIGDEAYNAGKYADAIAAYDKAVSLLKDGPLATRALLGRATAKVLTGKTAEGQADFKQVKDDSRQFKAARAEAAYSLASLANAAGNQTEANALIDELIKLDPSSAWTQRGMMLRLSMPPAPAPAIPAAAAPAPAASTPAPGAAPQIVIPGVK